MSDSKLPWELAAEYSARAESYARHWAPVTRLMARPLFASMPIAKARRVLDLGCGTSECEPDVRAAALSAMVFGADHALGMLRQAREKRGGPLAVTDAARLAFPDRAFDAVTLVFMLFHVPAPTAALREVERVLRTTGTTGVAVWGESDDPPWDIIWREELDALGADHDPCDASLMQHALMNTERKLSTLLESADLEPVLLWTESSPHSWAPDDLFEMHRNIGWQHRRLATLSEGARAACLERVRNRLFRLAPEQLVFRPDVVFAVARSAAASRGAASHSRGENRQ